MVNISRELAVYAVPPSVIILLTQNTQLECPCNEHAGVRLVLKVAEETEDAKERLRSVREELEQLHLDRPESSTLQEIDGTLVVYEEALDEELRLIETGQIDQALKVDEERVDPSFKELKEVLQRSSDTAGLNAQQHNRFANWRSALAFTLAACLIGLLFWLFERARRSAELFRIKSLETQNTLLQRSNRELRDFV